VTLVDPADAVAAQLGRVLAKEDLASSGSLGSTRYYTSGGVREMKHALRQLLGDTDGPIEQAPI